MQLDDEIRVHQPAEQVQAHPQPTITYSSPIPSPKHKAADFFSQPARYQIIAPFPGGAAQDSSHQSNKPAAAAVEPSPSNRDHSISIVIPSGHSESNTPSPLSELQYQDKSLLLSSVNQIVPILPSYREKEPWRRLSKTRQNMTAGTVKRSISTPNVHQAAAMSATSGGIQFSGDKRRNKLGYHRTSVACGHCRRRKIRCLLSKEDSQGRCSNCIRLKKECSFYPVESTERRPRSLSKPDISTNEASSSASSPSPGLALGKLPRTEIPSAYAASVPVTPTYDFHQGVLEDNLRHHSISSATSGRLSISHSTATSRRTSLAHIIPSLKAEQDYLNSPSVDNPNFTPLARYHMGPLTEVPHHGEHLGLDSAFWRLASSPVTPNQYPVYSSHVGLGSMTSLHSASDTQEEAVWPSRLNSIDQGLVPAYNYQQYPSDMEFSRSVPDLYNASASASTASLATSVPEITQFGESRVSSQLYLSPWADQSSIGTSFQADATMKQESYDLYPPVEEPPLIFPSPHQSPRYVS